MPRWSFAAFFIIVAAAIAGPSLLQTDPFESVARPFAPPVWTGGEEGPALAVSLSPSKTLFEKKWNWSPPENISIRGTLSFEEDPSASLVWTGPGGERFVLAVSGDTREWLIDIDARDVSFKASLGVPPFGNATSVLFRNHENIRVEIEGTTPSAGKIEIRTPGGKWGLMGTDQRGRDVLSLFTEGIRISLIVGLAATLISSALGLLVGLSSGYLGGKIDSFIMRGVDVLLSIPVLPILMVIVGIWGKGLWQLILILGLFSWMGTARTVRSLALTLRESCYVENLRSIGASPWYILWRHLVPEALPVLLAAVTLGVPGAILAEAGLSFLGLSDPRIISWGRMLHEAHGFGAFTAGAWWLILPPGIGISVICLVFLDMGRALEEIADPRLVKGNRK
ncbi:MAG TPA: ABC transporter permease [Synergistales bacterium]|nr:ABC transporter permease [Synergistales bacterium]HRV71846.1 ABC transporter permease [Thermovirgaceae bacterium]